MESPICTHNYGALGVGCMPWCDRIQAIKKPSDRIYELMKIIRKDVYPKKCFPNFEKNNKFMTHLRWMAVLAYLDEQHANRWDGRIGGLSP